jgi:hypothetical protein
MYKTASDGLCSKKISKPNRPMKSVEKYVGSLCRSEIHSTVPSYWNDFLLSNKRQEIQGVNEPQISPLCHAKTTYHKKIINTLRLFHFRAFTTSKRIYK